MVIAVGSLGVSATENAACVSMGQATDASTSATASTPVLARGLAVFRAIDPVCCNHNAQISSKNHPTSEDGLAGGQQQLKGVHTRCVPRPVHRLLSNQRNLAVFSSLSDGVSWSRFTTLGRRQPACSAAPQPAGRAAVAHPNFGARPVGSAYTVGRRHTART